MGKFGLTTPYECVAVNGSSLAFLPDLHIIIYISQFASRKALTMLTVLITGLRTLRRASNLVGLD